MSGNILAPTGAARNRVGRKRKLLAAGIVAGVVLAGAGATAAFAMNAHQETVRKCEAANKAFLKVVEGQGGASLVLVKDALAAADDASIQKAVPGATAYSARPEVPADAAKKITGRASAESLIMAAVEARDALPSTSMPIACESRTDAEHIQGAAKDVVAKAKKADEAAAALSADVAEFKSSEGKRIADAKAAAAKKAAAEKAAKEEAARVAAEQASVQQVAPESSWSGDGGGYVAPAPSGGGYVPAPAPSAPAPSGGGGGSYAPPPPSGNLGGCPPGVNCYL